MDESTGTPPSESKHPPRQRRVQWASLREDNIPSPHALDELGQDPDAFETLKEALERHKSIRNGNVISELTPEGPSSTSASGTPFQNISAEATDVLTTQLPGVYVAPHETDGLPTNNDAPSNVSPRARAAGLVKAHKTGRFAFLRKRTKPRTNTPNFHQQLPATDIEKGPATSVGPQTNPPGKQTGGPGVLSSLLSLYEHRQRSGTSTPTAYSTDDEEYHSPSEDLSRQSRTSSGDTLSRYFLSNHPRSNASGPSKSPPGTPPLTIARAIKDKLPSSRPAAARSGAGVFGGLIASTSNIVGVVTPTAGSIAPNLKRAGFHVNRYSLESRSKSGGGTRSAPHSRPASIYEDVEDTEMTKKESTPNTEASSTANASSDTVGELKTHMKSRSGLSLKDLPKLHALASSAAGWLTPSRSGTPLPQEDSAMDHFSGGEKYSSGYAGSGTMTPRSAKKEWEERRRARKKEKRRKQEIFITQHVAEIIARQQFILKLARALMMFGAPAHRLETQIQNTGRVLDLQVSCMYLPGVMLISFGDSETHTSETRFVKQAPNLDLGKLKAVHEVYWKVIHDEISVVDAQDSLDELMKKDPVYKGVVSIIIGGLCSASITPLAFRGSFVDALSAFPLGCLLVWMENVVSTNDLFTNVFEILIATLVSFLSAALGSTTHLCYTAIASGSVVLILPGYIVLCGSLEIASRNITSGAVRLGYSIIYSLFLGFGLSIGAEIYHQISGNPVFGAEDYLCAATHKADGPWWQRNVSDYWSFLLVPMYSAVLSLRSQQPIKAKELPIMVFMACAGWTVNHFATIRFVNRNDITSALGSFVVGVLGNLYGRFFAGNAFVIMLTGILFQVPTGLSNGGLLSFASQTASGNSSSYSTGFGVAEQLVSVAIGLTVGLFASAVVVHPFGGSKRRGAGLFSL